MTVATIDYQLYLVIDYLSYNNFIRSFAPCVMIRNRRDGSGISPINAGELNPSTFDAQIIYRAHFIKEPH